MSVGDAGEALYHLYFQPPLLGAGMLWLWAGCVAFFEVRQGGRGAGRGWGGPILYVGGGGGLARAAGRARDHARDHARTPSNPTNPSFTC